MVGTSYVNYTLEVDDHIENPVVNFRGMDCWTYYENALAFARMLRYKPAPYRPEDMLHMIEIERYRGGKCTGSYLSRMHHLEEVFADNETDQVRVILSAFGDMYQFFLNSLTPPSPPSRRRLTSRTSCSNH